jgi:hypothetical protein
MPSISTEQQRALVARVLASHVMARSARLQAFLQYVAEQAVEHPEVEIHEPEVAERVFGRTATVSGDDSIVRVYASQLRKRLEQYFSTEGSAEELVLDIPKGNYKPLFRRRAAAAKPAVAREARATPGWMAWALAAAALALAALGWDDWRLRGGRGETLTPYMAKFWSEFTDSRQPLDLVLADSNFGFLRDFSDTEVSLEQYANRDYAWLVDVFGSSDRLKEGANRLLHRRFTSMADANIARRVAVLAETRVDRAQIIHARDYQSMRLRSNQVVLVGGKRANPWVELFESAMNFRYEYPGRGAEVLIRNVKPLANEQPTYHVGAVSGERIPGGYCVVARVANLGGHGKVLLIAGTESEATEAGGDFVLNEGSLAELHRALGLRPGEPFPDFEVLLRTTRVGGSAPAAQVLSVRRH